MKEIPMLERFAAQSLVEHEGELIFSKEKFAELIVRECCQKLEDDGMVEVAIEMKQHFGVDGMSTEDKKTLIKELLRVKNERKN